MDPVRIIDRRNALKAILMGVVSFPVISYLYHGKHSNRELVITQGEINSLPFVKQNVFINRNAQSEIIVLSLKCTHLGCNLNYDKQKQLFICPCHGSVFNIDGTNIKGPAKISLARLKYQFDNQGNLIVRIID